MIDWVFENSQDFSYSGFVKCWYQDEDKYTAEDEAGAERVFTTFNNAVAAKL